MQKPDCKCFANGEQTGERICLNVARDAAACFINYAHQDGICDKAIYHAALTAIAIILDGVGNVQTRGAAAASHASGMAQFELQASTLIEDIRQRRAEMDAQLTLEQGATVN